MNPDFALIAALLPAPLTALQVDDAPVTNKPTPSDLDRERLIVLVFDHTAHLRLNQPDSEAMPPLLKRNAWLRRVV